MKTKRKTALGAKPTRKAMKSVVSEVAALQGMSGARLKAKYAEVFGHATRSSNLVWLRKKLAHELQVRADGGLSEAAEARIDALATQSPVQPLAKRGRKPTQQVPPAQSTPSTTPAADDEPTTKPTPPTPRPPTKPRDPRLPPVGTELVVMERKTGREHRVLVLEHGFIYRFQTFKSLSAVAKFATGQVWNGFIWAGLAKRAPTNETKS